MPKGINWNEQFYKLLRLSLGLTQEFLVDVDADGWRRMKELANSCLVLDSFSMIHLGVSRILRIFAPL